MYLTDLSIKRPVVATVMSLVLVIFGLVTFNKIPLRELPDVDSAKINIRTDYTGASAVIVDTQITQKIEDRIGGTPGIVTINSTSEDGRSSITLEFDLDVDLDVAANDVRERLARIVDNLPDGAEPPEIYKSSAARTTTMWLAFQSPSMTDLELTDYADRYLKDLFSTVPGVGNIRLGGEREFSLRIWLDPIAMAARNITVLELESILKKENVEFPAGKIESKYIDLVIKVEKAYNKLQDYKNLVLKRANDGSLIKLGDIARLEFGALNSNTLFKGNGNQTVGIGIYQQSTANTIEVARAIKKKIKEIRPSLPDDSSLSVSFDRSTYIETAIYEVYKTLFIAIILVILIIYLFLGNITGVIIPAVAIPVALISTFLAIYLAGFTLNLFTLMALVLAIGIVVDDAIVMGENISRRLEKGETSLVAAYRGSKQVAFAIIATTVVLVSVFIPLIFIKGLIGKLFSEMALTLSFAVVISSFVALSLSPMIGSKFLKISKRKPRPILKFEKYLNRFQKFYEETLNYMLKRRKSIFVFLTLILISIVSLFNFTKKELMPKEDRGVFFIIIQAPEGSGFNYTAEKALDIESKFLPALVVNPLLTIEDCRLIQKTLNISQIENSNSIGNIVMKIMNSVSNHCETRNYEQLQNEITFILKNNQRSNDFEGGKPMLKDLITQENIQIKVEAKNWEDAVYKGAKPLLDKGCITKKYIDAIMNKVKEIGPYIVISPGVALPHARPEDGVKKLSMSIMTLKNPVEFGNKDNDPVKLLITLAAVDNEIHLKALSQLMGLLNNSGDIKRIFKAEDKHEVLKILEKYSK